MSIHTPASTSHLLAGYPVSMPEALPATPAARLGVGRMSITILSDNKIFRTCLARCLQTMTHDFEVSCHDGAQAWLSGGEEPADGIVLLCATGQKATEAAIRNDLNEVLHNVGGARVIIISDEESPTHMMEALTMGARGFVTMDTDLDVTLGAIRLVSVGGTFIPASGLMSARAAQVAATAAPAPKTGGFSQRQLEVLELARLGDPNKIIAFKLSMSEATVKVHLRNMMRKLKARNRTELIFKSNELLGIG
ncbi:LuxR C-terminal-related transcriptional regulator [Labrys okinawensis]|uniref:LuxR C-terminal-related transcriptional regulator n=1 Tax=Labrys okinawensis TaxID=346911 RepID=UPI0039BD25EF